MAVNGSSGSHTETNDSGEAGGNDSSGFVSETAA